MWAVDLVAIAVVAALFQLVPWYRDVGVIEEWATYSGFDAGGLVWWTPSSPGLAVQAIRPFTVVPHAIAYTLTSDSFVGLQVVQAAGIAAKAAGMMLVLRALGIRRPMVLAGGLLYGLFPAHDASFTLRAVHMHWSSSFFVIALWLLILQVERGRVSLLLGVPMALSQVICLFIYEAPYGLVALAPLILLCRQGLAWRARLIFTAVWFAVPFLNGIRIVQLMTSGQKLYEEQVTESHGRNANELVDLLRLVARGAVSPVDAPHGHAVAPLVLGSLIAIFGVAAWGRARGWRPAAIGPAWRYGWLAAGALILAPIAALSYAVRPFYLTDPIRVFSVVAVPLTIGICAAATLLGRRVDWADTAVAVVLVPLVLTAAQAHRAYWHDRSDEQERALGAIIAAAPNPARPMPLVVSDPQGILGRDSYALPRPLLRTALRYVAHAPAGAAEQCGALDGKPHPPASICTAAAGAVTVDGQRVDYPVVVLHRPRPGERTPIRDDLTRRERSVLPCLAAGTCANGPRGVAAELAQAAAAPAP